MQRFGKQYWPKSKYMLDNRFHLLVHVQLLVIDGSAIVFPYNISFFAFSVQWIDFLNDPPTTARGGDNAGC